MSTTLNTYAFVFCSKKRKDQNNVPKFNSTSKCMVLRKFSVSIKGQELRFNTARFNIAGKKYRCIVETEILVQIKVNLEGVDTEVRILCCRCTSRSTSRLDSKPIYTIISKNARELFVLCSVRCNVFFLIKGSNITSGASKQPNTCYIIEVVYPTFNLSCFYILGRSN